MKNKVILSLIVAVALLVLAACGGQTSDEPFVIGAIPDQDPEKLQREYSRLADYLSEGCTVVQFCS